MSSGMCTRRTTETMVKFACEMRIVAKATGIGDLAKRLPCAKQRAAVQQMRGMIQPKRIDVFAAGGAAFGKKLLNVTQ